MLKFLLVGGEVKRIFTSAIESLGHEILPNTIGNLDRADVILVHISNYTSVFGPSISKTIVLRWQAMGEATQRKQTEEIKGHGFKNLLVLPEGKAPREFLEESVLSLFSSPS